MPTGNIGNAAILQALGRDTRLGVLTKHLLENHRTGAAPLTASATVLVAAVLPTTGGTQTHTIAAQPDVYRAVTMTITDADASIQKITATIRGTDYDGNSQEAVLIGTSATVFTTDVAFATITSITTVTVGTPAGLDRVSFGTSATLGVPGRIASEADIEHKYIDSTEDTSGTITVTGSGYALWAPASAPNNTRVFRMWIASRYGVPS
jgi:hypothetical protein